MRASKGDNSWEEGAERSGDATRRVAASHSGAEMRYSGKNVFIVLNDTLKRCDQPREEIFEIRLLDQYENCIFKKVFSAFFHFYAKKSVTNFFAGQIVAKRLLRGV